ncbi:MAG: TetR family transcriptional regulator [Pseudomonadota bacterium]
MATAKGEHRKSIILDRARDVLIRDGFAKFTVRDVAAAAGISLGNLQYYFPSRDDLVASVIETELTASFAIIEAVNWRDGDLDTQILVLTRALLTHLAGDAGKLHQIMAFLALNDVRFQKLMDESYGRILDIARTTLRKALPSVGDDDDAQNTSAAMIPGLAEVIVALFDGALTRIHAQPSIMHGAARDAYIDRINDTVIHILAGAEHATG